MMFLLMANLMRSKLFHRPILRWLAALIVLGAVAAVSSSVYVAEAQSPSWNRLVPPGLERGDSFRILFVTSSDADMEKTNDIVKYNEYVQAVAETSPAFSSYYEFKILGSTACLSARDNTETDPESNGPGEPIYYYLGEKVADDYADFYDGSWDSNEPRDENGDTFSGSSIEVSTGTTPDGDGAHVCGQYACQPFVIGTGGPILTGHPMQRGAELDSKTSPPSRLHRFYVLSEPLVVLSESDVITKRDYVEWVAPE